MINKTNRILNIFDEKDQNILKMRYIEGKTNSQIAYAMGYSHGYIRLRITILMEFVDLIDK
ncbi:sigma factor-like helix-turn-helix DNA-binding protein [Globicatella sulfidifaciens]|uniref:sigma factor-like helix-turn-helix DNA-binding protein n=1 Tax=Globicatella sulfidifaciens TaxID=136093 RepID=UPI003898F045